MADETRGDDAEEPKRTELPATEAALHGVTPKRQGGPVRRWIAAEEPGDSILSRLTRPTDHGCPGGGRIEESS